MTLVAVLPGGGRGGHNYDAVTGLVAERVAKTQGRITAKPRSTDRLELNRCFWIGVVLGCAGRGGWSRLAAGVFHWWLSGWAGVRRGGQDVVVGGPQVWSNSAVH